MVLEDPQGSFLKRPTNICFGWKNLETAFIGSLDGTGIPHFPSPISRDGKGASLPLTLARNLQKQ